MERFKKILLALNPESEELTALGRAVALARQNQAGLDVIVVPEHLPLDDLPWGTRTLIGRLDGDELQDMITHRQWTLVQKGLTALSAGDLRVGISVEWSHTPFLTIIRKVLREGYDLLIKTAEHVFSPTAALFHPTDRHLIRKCPCPVWMIRPEKHAGYKRILAAVDSFRRDEINADLNRHILDLACSQATRDSAEIHVVHAYHVRSQVLLPTGINVEEYRKTVARLHRERLEELLEGFSIPKQHVHLEEGWPGEVITAVARRERADMIVMGTLARVGIPGLFIGNTAERALDHVDCDILAIKPRGFVTPVSLSDEV
jgi:nucleotide-binding universal stress UspA family protein